MTSSSFATRCPACGTTFKVDADQLRISDGWVRCGRCSEIFDGQEQLQEAGSEPVSPSPDLAGEGNEDRATEKVDSEAAAAADGMVPAPWLGHWPSLDLEAAVPSVQAEPEPKRAPTVVAVPAAPSVPPETASEVPFDVARAAVLAEPAAAPSSTDEPESPKPGDRSEHSGFASLDQPESRVMRWLRRFPGLDRLPLRSISAGALVLLAAQAVYQSRDAIAANRPSFAPALTAMCKAAGCTVSALRRIDAISIDSASFARDPGGEGYQLAFTLRNSAAVPLEMPAIELTLLDTQEQPVVRRVLIPRDFSAPDLLPANAERSTLLPLAISDAATLAPVAGYGIAAFYP